ncbi:PP2C family protein-serine/threonine phosphatase [Leptolyngbya sp. NIES-2104]|uniref:PP2C family protein-serine/threonine phosphatase n=1 Tax=Leptolyngbya sp. NIES-2104 TaxID=1552121 RepID=UPI0006EC9BED|nr:PP2C family serine/threonine-protein phosphatase [Leptolyngbya sp. NIES-2104]GAP97947.1 protein serine/threonine phosphatase PrpC [Leptolyngbya sp. NIES-2104]
MQTDPIVQCPNYFCQALNPESQEFCHHCQTRIPKRYLWAVGATEPPGTLIDDRFLLKSDQIALDTKPGLPPTAIEIPPPLEPYLHLMGERPAIPQPYAVTGGILFLESAPIHPSGARSQRGEDLSGQLMPRLVQVWNSSSGFRQLHFLQQLAQLWRSLAIEKAASTLLDPDLIFVDGDTVRILELDFNSATLADLGKFWSTWQAQPAIADFFEQLCQNLIQGTSIDELNQVLDAAIASQASQQSRQIQIATLSDQGPSRQTNEDACYPSSGTSGNQPLIIVCDGIGGHEGGEVASNLAIQTIVDELRSIEPNHLESRLEEAVCAANDAIAQKNDAERRQERQRMGTTVVMGLVQGHELFLTHVGDSRAYRITRQGCYQVTLDDDVASREARLGYTFYREALQHPSAGSLVQALGMGSSSYLRPTVQRFVLDQDCVFLLCSDGLSDNDRVEEYWQSEIVPILDGKTNPATVARRLVEIANTQNGHDNVTIGLIHCQTRETGKSTVVKSVLAKPTQVVVPATSPPGLRTELQPRRTPWLRAGFVLLVMFGIAGAIVALFAPELIARLGTQAPTTTAPTVPPVPASPEPLTSGTIIRIDQAGARLFRKPEATGAFVSIPPGTVLQVETQQRSTSDAAPWIRLKVCTVPVNLPNGVRIGNAGWQQEDTLPSFTRPTLSAEQLRACAPTKPTTPPAQ